MSHPHQDLRSREMLPAPRKKLSLALSLVALLVLLVSLVLFSWQAAPSLGQEPRWAQTGPADAPPLPVPEPQLVRQLTAEQAKAANDALPFAKNARESAYAFAPDEAFANPLAYSAALDCLTTAVYYEAAAEGSRGQRAVAQVVLNRVRHPAFPAEVCDVVYQGSERQTGCQFTFTCDGSLARRPPQASWGRARKIAADALAGFVEPSVGMATHFHANWVLPYWAPRLDKIAVVGGHIFYRWPGHWGRRRAFIQPYAGETIAELQAPVSADDLVSAGEKALPSIAAPSPLAHLRATLPASEAVHLEEDEETYSLLADENAVPSLAADEKDRARGSDNPLRGD